MRRYVDIIGNKVVTGLVVSDHKIAESRALVDQALAGKLKFAWRRVVPYRRRHYTPARLAHLLNTDTRNLVGPDYDDVVRHKRAERWNRRNAHSLFPTDKLIEDWKLNLTRIRRAIKYLKLANVIEYGHITGTGRMEITWKSSGDTSKFHDLCGRDIKTSKRQQMSENELSARRRGKLRNLSSEDYEYAVNMERAHQLRERAYLTRDFAGQIGKMLHVRTGKYDIYMYTHLAIIPPEISTANNYDVYYRFLPDENDRLRGMNTVVATQSKTTDVEYESLVASANDRLTELYGGNFFMREREKKIYHITILNIARMMCNIQEPKKKEAIRNISAEKTFVNPNL